LIPTGLLDLIRRRGARIVAVEGAPNSGKTTLARSLGSELPASVLSVDDYVVGSGEMPYPNLVDCVKLGRDVSARITDGQIVIVEGICLREVTGKAGVVPAFFVYARNLGNETDHVSSDLRPSELQSFEREYHQESLELGIVTNLTLALENARYHSLHKPVAQADYIYEWRGT
jgi:hypothetical protein